MRQLLARSCFYLSLLAVAACSTAAGSSQQPAGRTADPGVEQVLAQKSRPPFVSDDAEGRELWKHTRAFYEQNGVQPAWIVDRRPQRQAQELLDAILHANREGLSPADYDIEALSAVRRPRSRMPFLRHRVAEEAAAPLDVHLTYTFMKLAKHLSSGRINPEGIDPLWHVAPQERNYVDILNEALESGRVADALWARAPQHPGYQALKHSLERHRAIAEAGGWHEVPEGKAMQLGASGPMVAALRDRLAASGDFAHSAAAYFRRAQNTAPSDAEPAAAFDAVLDEAVKRFQSRHGLNPDGIVGANTYAELNTPVEERIRQIEMNLERWRWLPATLGDKHLVVNVPAFRLEGFENGRRAIEMAVVVGKPDSPTPIFADTMTLVVFSPHWNIPPGIARDETIPAAQREPGYLERNNMEVLRNGNPVDPYSVDWSSAADDPTLRIRQKPGPANSLGHVKFLFPNTFNVYLHDTPADALFERIARDYSHGCVRVEQPSALASWVLADNPEWTGDRIHDAMMSGTEKFVKMNTPIPVYLLYFTASVDSTGITQFRSDLYGHDRTHARLLGDRFSSAAQTTSQR